MGNLRPKSLLPANGSVLGCECFMCEFNVILNGKTRIKDVVYAKSQGSNVVVKSVLGETMEFKDCIIVEVDVNATKLVLTSK